MSQPVYAVIDIETTGMDFEKGDRIIQIGCSIVKNQKIIDSFDTYIQPQRTIPNEITSLTKITDRDVKNAPVFEEVAPFLYHLLSDTIFVAHGAKFDFHFINESLKSCGYDDLKVPIIDTLELAQVVFPEIRRYKLDLLAYDLGLNLKQAHSAYFDALVTAEILIKCKERIRSLPIETISAIIHRNEAFLFDNVILFETIYKENKMTNKTNTQNLTRIYPNVWIKNHFFKLLNMKAFEFQSSDFSNEDIKITIEEHGSINTDARTIEQLAKKDYLLVATTVAYLNERLHFDKEQMNKLYMPYEYIHIERFYNLFNQFHQMARFSQLTLLSILVWLTITEDGSFKPLGRISRDRKVINEISCRQNDLKSSHNSYWANLLATHDKPIIFVSNNYLINYGNQFNRRIVIHNLQEFKKTLVNHYSLELDLNQIRKEIENFVDNHLSNFEATDYIILTQHINQIDSFLNLAIQSYNRLIESTGSKDHSSESVNDYYYDHQTMHQSDLFYSLNLIKKSARLINNIFKRNHYRFNFYQLEILEHLLEYDSRFIFQLLDDRLTIKKVLVSFDQLLRDKINSWDRPTTIFYFQRHTIEFLNQFELNELEKSRSSYSKVSSSIKIINTRINRDQVAREKEDLDDVAQLIQKLYNKEKQLLLIVCTSQFQIDNLYHKLKSNFFDQLLAQNITGKGDVILKSINLKEKPIIILLHKWLDQFNWNVTQLSNVIITKLPFPYLNDSIVKSNELYYEQLNSSFFKEWYYPEMIETLSSIFYSIDWYDKTYWLLDSRLNRQIYRTDFFKDFKNEFVLETFEMDDI